MFNGDDARIEAGTLKIEARVSSVENEIRYELQQRYPVFLHYLHPCLRQAGSMHYAIYLI